MEATSKVLIVDDEESNVDMLSRRLSRCGYRVLTAAGGREALLILESEQVDLILLDQMMPGMTGIEVLRRVRSASTTQKLPVIMVTAVSDSSAIADALDLGANDYITKPVDFQIALARIRMQLTLGREGSKVRLSEERHALAARGSGEGLWDWDIALDTVFCTAELHNLAGQKPREESYRPSACFAQIHPSDRIAAKSAFSRCLERGSVGDDRERTEEHDDASDEISCQFRFRHARGGYRWFSLRGVTLRNTSGEPIRRVGSVTDVTARTSIDTLTGLASKRVLLDEIDAALRRRAVDGTSTFCVLLLDIDHFKLVKPTLVQSSTQMLLVAFAERVQKVVQEFIDGREGIHFHQPVLARINEGEFGILLQPFDAQPEAESIATRLSFAMRPPFVIAGREIFCSISTGIVLSRERYKSSEEVLSDANTAMFAAEMRGTGCQVVFEESMRRLRDQRIQMDIDLRLALQRNEFEVYYQSRVHLESGVICGFEALVRWNHPTRGMVPPLEFIAVAEENGLIHAVGLQVLEKACEQAQAWRKQFNLADDFEVSVNLSPRQCKEPELVQQVLTILARTGLPASSLNLELTESVLMEDVNQAKSVLRELKDIGVGLKIDDFGTGYSNLKYLCDFPFDSLKIDRSFTKELGKENAETEEIVRTIVQMAANLKMEVVAEGVETAAHVSHLKNLGCKYGQGYYFSRPVNAAAVEQMLASYASRSPQHKIPGRSEDGVVRRGEAA